MDQRKRSYYDILGLPKTASSAQIKETFWNLSKKHHPDIGGDKTAYQEMAEASMTLTDANKRKEYDNKLASQPDINAGTSATVAKLNIDAMINDALLRFEWSKYRESLYLHFATHPWLLFVGTFTYLTKRKNIVICRERKGWFYSEYIARFLPGEKRCKQLSDKYDRIIVRKRMVIGQIGRWPWRKQWILVPKTGAKLHEKGARYIIEKKDRAIRSDIFLGWFF